MVTAGPSFCVAPDPLLDLHESYSAPRLYAPGFANRTFAYARELREREANEAFIRSWRAHPSNQPSNQQEDA